MLLSEGAEATSPLGCLFTVPYPGPSPEEERAQHFRNRA